MKKRLLATGLCLGFLAAAQAASAFVYDFEGAAASGSNDSAVTAQHLGTLAAGGALTVLGWADANNPNDIDFYSFAVASPAGVFFDVDYADGIAGTDPDSGLDAYLAVFNSSQQLIAYNDDSSVFNYTTTDPGSLPFGDFDPFLGELTLAPGTYYAAIASFAKLPNALNQPGITTTDLTVSGTLVDGVLADSTFTLGGETSGQYQLQIRGTVEDQPIGPAPVPVPPAVLLFGPGLAGLYAARKRNRNK